MGFTPIERSGDVLWRPARPWNDAVHSLLTYLRSVGFDGAPVSLGVADDGRHELGWVHGEAGDSAGDADERLVSLAHLIRRYHEAVLGFVPPVGLQVLVGAPATGPIVCHNDLGPVNTVFVGDEAIALIDWDMAGPGDASWDLAYAAWRSVPLYEDAFFVARGLPVPDRCRRMRLFADAYGLEDRQRFADLICERIRSLYDTAKLWGGEQGRPGWSDVWRDTAGHQWLRSLDFAERNTSTWTDALTA